MEDKSLETIRAEAEEKVEKLRHETEANNAALLMAYKKQASAFDKANQKAKHAERQLEKKRGEVESIRHEIRCKQDEAQSLRGLFTGKKRRRIESEIAELDAAARASEELLADLERQYSMARAEVPGKRPEAPRLTDEQELTYQCAKIYEQAGLYVQAAREYGRIRGYRDVNGILEGNEHFIAAVDAILLAQLQPGKFVTFGRYRQSSDVPHPEPIEWIVLKNDGKTARLLSRHGLFTDCYNAFNMYEDGIGNLHGCRRSTWEECTLRQRLNGEFLDTAFTTAEQSKLATMKVLPDANPKYPSDPGKATMDKVCILSAKEFERYKKIEAVQSCLPTQLAAKTCGRRNASGNCDWWLRTPGEEDYMAVYSSWPSNPWGCYANIKRLAVRPVIALKLSELEHEH